MPDPKEFFDAVRAGDAAKVDAMLAENRGLLAAKTERGLSAVAVAAYSGKHEAMKVLLAHKPTLTVHEAALAGDLKRVRALVEKDPRLANDASSPGGFPPLGLAAFLGREEVVSYLLSKGADVDFASAQMGFTALTGAVSSNHAGVVKLLLAAGARVSNQYEGGEASILVTAAANGNPEIVRMLLDAGANVNTRTKDGHTPLSMAVEKGHAEVVDVLRRHGAKA